MEPPALFLGISLKNVEILVESVKTAVSGSEEKSAQLRVREVKCAAAGQVDTVATVARSVAFINLSLVMVADRG